MENRYTKVAGDFDYGSDFLGNGNIEATNQYFTIRNGDFSNNTNKSWNNSR